MSDEREPSGGPAPDHSRTLGVIEALTAVKDQCPSANVRSVAEQALDVVKEKGAGALPEQVFYVLTAMRGWRGDRAAQVHRSLEAFLEQGRRGGGRHE